MKIAIVLGFAVFAVNASAAEGVQSWASTPKEILFKEFKNMKTVNTEGRTSTFEKQKEQYFKLSKAFDGDNTKICYGSTNIDVKTHKASGVACVLSEIGAKSCASADFKKCADDMSIEPIR